MHAAAVARSARHEPMDLKKKMNKKSAKNGQFSRQLILMTEVGSFRSSAAAPGLVRIPDLASRTPEGGLRKGSRQRAILRHRQPENRYESGPRRRSEREHRKIFLFFVHLIPTTSNPANSTNCSKSGDGQLSPRRGRTNPIVGQSPSSTARRSADHRRFEPRGIRVENRTENTTDG